MLHLGVRGLVLAALIGSAAWAQDPLNFTHIQTDATTGAGNLGGQINGVLFGGTMQMPTVTQNDASAQPVPGNAVGFITGGTTGNPGGGIGVHLGWSGTTTLTGQIRDDLDPNTVTSDSSKFNVYSVDVSMSAVVGTPHDYQFNTFDDNSSVAGTSDVTNTLTHRGWIGDNGGGHRHSDGSFGYGAGPDTFTAAASFSLAGGASGDDLGITAGVGGTAPNDTLFVDDITFRGVLNTTGAPTFVESIAAPTAKDGLITGVNVTGTGLDPAGAAVQTGAFGEDALAFTDRTHEWNTAGGQPSFASLDLDGVDYIQFANDDRSVGDLEAEISFAPGLKDIYLLVDDRVNTANELNIFNENPFVDTGINFGVDESGDGDIDQLSSLFLLPDFEGLSLTLGAQNQGGTNMIGVLAAPVANAVIPEPASIAIWSLLGLGLAGFGYCRVRRKK